MNIEQAKEKWFELLKEGLEYRASLTDEDLCELVDEIRELENPMDIRIKNKDGLFVDIEDWFLVNGHGNTSHAVDRLLDKNNLKYDMVSDDTVDKYIFNTKIGSDIMTFLVTEDINNNLNLMVINTQTSEIEENQELNSLSEIQIYIDRYSF